MKITARVTTVKEVEIEIKFPAYYKSIAHNIKAVSETKCIWVTNSIDIQTSLDPSYHLFGNDMYSPSTPEEFNAALEAAINHINELNK